MIVLPVHSTRMVVSLVDINEHPRLRYGEPVQTEDPSGHRRDVIFLSRERHYLDQLLNPIYDHDPEMQRAAQLYSRRTGRTEGFVDTMWVEEPSNFHFDPVEAKKSDERGSWATQGALVNDLHYRAEETGDPTLLDYAEQIARLHQDNPAANNAEIKRLYTEAREYETKQGAYDPNMKADARRKLDEIEDLMSEIRDARSGATGTRADAMDEALDILDELHVEVQRHGETPDYDVKIARVNEILLGNDF